METLYKNKNTGVIVSKWQYDLIPRDEKTYYIARLNTKIDNIRISKKDNSK